MLGSKGGQAAQAFRRRKGLRAVITREDNSAYKWGREAKHTSILNDVEEGETDAKRAEGSAWQTEVLVKSEDC